MELACSIILNFFNGSDRVLQEPECVHFLNFRWAESQLTAAFVSTRVTLAMQLRLFLFNQYSKGPYQEIENIYELSDCTPSLLFV